MLLTPSLHVPKIICGVDYLHRRGLFHGRLCLANLLVNETGVLKIGTRSFPHTGDVR